MKLFSRLALFGALLLAAIGSAFAQSYSGVQLTLPVTSRTYSAAITGLVPAASATDFLTITGVNGHIVRITRAECSGTSTAAGAATVVALVRSTADSGGTSTSPTAVAADGNDTAAGATVAAYTANPTAGTLVGNVRASTAILTPPSSSIDASPLVWTFGNQPLTRAGIVLRDANHVFALNGNGASFPAGALLNCSVEWVEQ